MRFSPWFQPGDRRANHQEEKTLVKITALRLRQLTGTMEHEERVLGGAADPPDRRLPRAQAPSRPTSASGMPCKIEDGRYRMQLRLPRDRDRRGRHRARRADRPRRRLHHRPAVPQPADRRGPAGHRADLGQDVPRRRPRPQGRDDDGDQRHRLRPLGPQGQVGSTQPVYRLLGGPMRDANPGLRQHARLLARAGAGAPRGRERSSPRATRRRSGSPATVRPTAARDRPQRRADARRCARRSGPDVDIMLDAWMSWDVPYTLADGRAAGRVRPALDRGAGAAGQDRRLRRDPPPLPRPDRHRRARVHPLGPQAAARRRAADVLQPDTYWAGGICEMLKICALASVYDLPVIPHGHSVPANVHLSAAHAGRWPCRYVEFLVKWNEILQFFWKEPLVPVNGIGHRARPPRHGHGARHGQDRGGAGAGLERQADDDR